MVLTGKADTVRPEWFRQPGEADSYSKALQRAIDSCAGLCTLWLSTYQGVSKVGNKLRGRRFGIADLLCSLCSML